MIDYKTEDEIKIMAEGGHILSSVLWEVLGNAKPGVSEVELDKLAEELIIKKGGEPGFKKVENYPNATCISVNDVVVHGLPTKYVLAEGDVLGVDCGVFYKGFHTDMAHTIRVSLDKSSNPEIDRFLEVGERAMYEGIKMAKPGNRVGHISKAVQDIVEKEAGYSIVRTLVGHGVGRELHEDPHIPGFLRGQISKTPKLEPGMTITVEVIYNMGKHDVVLDKDKWTIRSKDKSISGLFERSLAVTSKGPLILTN
jgi:methionyl aminopeptidase